jgi:predicted DCC family thiol-disulfide oxidoreductase YuxK
LANGCPSRIGSGEERPSIDLIADKKRRKRSFKLGHLTSNIDRAGLIRMAGSAVSPVMKAKPVILYNGACPICRKEIEHYQRLDRSGADALTFADIGGSKQELALLSLSEDEAKRRLHVVDAEGRLMSGVPAFATIWESLPRYRWLSTLCRLPVLRTLLDWLYEPIAFCLYHLDKKRQRRDPASSI